MINKTKENSLNHSELLRILDYDRLTGIFTWKISTGRIKCGNMAGTKRMDGYFIITINKNKYRSNRLALFYVNGVWPNGIADHKNGLSNAYDNLRDATDSENQQNQRRAHKRNKSASNISGVSLDRGKWVIRLCPNGIHKRYGKFETQEEAEKECIRLRRILYKGNLL